MKLLELIAVVLRKNKSAMHVDDIAIALCQEFPNLQIPIDQLPQKISSVLSSDIKRQKSKSLFSKPRNKQGGFQRGVYRIKSERRRVSKEIVVPEQPKVKPLYTGHAGEHAVLSELLFFGYNASIMTVDDGIDIVASKENNYFHIQVKTSNPGANNKYTFGINMRAFDAKDAANTFYILVLRLFENKKYSNDYIVISNSEIRRFIESGIVKSAEKLSLRIEIDRNGRFILNDGEDISWCRNRFDHIK